MRAENIKGQLKARGFRLTKAREVIIESLVKASSPLSASEIGTELKRKRVGVNKTTVYRELIFLTDQEVIVPVQLKARYQHYEIADLPHHHHFVCDRCGEVKELICEEIDRKIGEWAKKVGKQGVSVKSHKLEFAGACGNCRV